MVWNCQTAPGVAILAKLVRSLRGALRELAERQPGQWSRGFAGSKARKMNAENMLDESTRRAKIFDIRSVWNVK
jgi:hypothetical protein